MEDLLLYPSRRSDAVLLHSVTSRVQFVEQYSIQQLNPFPSLPHLLQGLAFPLQSNQGGFSPCCFHSKNVRQSSSSATSIFTSLSLDCNQQPLPTTSATFRPRRTAWTCFTASTSHSSFRLQCGQLSV